MRKLTSKEFDDLSKTGQYGIYCEYGAIVSGYEEILIEGDNGQYLVPANMFDCAGIAVAPKSELLCAINTH